MCVGRGRSPRAPLGGGTFVLHPAASAEAAAPAAAEPVAVPPQHPQAQAVQSATEAPAHQAGSAAEAIAGGTQQAAARMQSVAVV